MDTAFPHDGLRKTRGGDSIAAAERPGQPRPLSGAEFESEANQIELDLSTLVVEEPTVWQFGELRPWSQRLLDQADSAVERGRARLLLGKIARFEDMKQRYDHVNALHDEIERSDRQLARVSPRPNGVSPQFDTEGRYDGVGTLTRVSSPRTGAPQYALLDEYGRVRYYVTPGPGMNLRDHLGRQVGINGTRGYMPEQQTNHSHGPAHQPDRRHGAAVGVRSRGVRPGACRHDRWGASGRFLRVRTRYANISVAIGRLTSRLTKQPREIVAEMP